MSVFTLKFFMRFARRCQASYPVPVAGLVLAANNNLNAFEPGREVQSEGHLTRKSGVLGSIPGLATYFSFSFCFFEKGSCQLLAKVCARSTG